MIIFVGRTNGFDGRAVKCHHDRARIFFELRERETVYGPPRTPAPPLGALWGQLAGTLYQGVDGGKPGWLLGFNDCAGSEERLRLERCRKAKSPQAYDELR